MISITLATALVATLLQGAEAPVAKVQVSYLYDLSDATGPIPSIWASLAWDEERGELYVVDTRANEVQIFNQKGMEVFNFGDVEGLTNVASVAVLPGGDLLALVWVDGQSRVVRANFRGEVKGDWVPSGVPEKFAKDFLPGTVVVAANKVFLADKSRMKVLVTDLEGEVETSHDFAEAMKLTGKKADDAGMSGFSVDREGNILFTVPTMFLAFVVAPDGKLDAFGVRGSAPGRFNIVGGIARDEGGNFFVTDQLRSVVLVFDSKFNFIDEFGFYGPFPGGLCSPLDLVVANKKVFVAQSRERGVSVFNVRIN